ncbi:MAG TPA: mycofactocin biosynthesis glycosyltransferase MftF [Acidimicrobiales bacterium]|nr:mycofactocin biosynthesis glycosyltransferase MftF [Acidimicrobiales bacterium]
MDEPPAGGRDLPEGFGLAPDPGTRRIDGGRVLVGGSPLRLLRLTPAGSRTLDGWWEGRPVGPAPGEQGLARRLLDAGMAHPRPPTPSGPLRSDVTLVVPAHGRPDGLARVLTALGPHVGEMIVVDDASPDRPAIEAAVRTAPGAPVRLLVHDRSGGPAAARNTGWRAAQTPLVLFVDTDCSAPRPGGGGWLAALGAHLADPAVAAVAPRVVADPASAPARLAAYDSVRSPLDLGPAEAPVRPRSRVPFVPAAALLVRRDALDEVGGFDEELRVGEDVDLVWRLARAGWTVRYEPTATIAHEVRPGLGAWLHQRFAYGTSAAPLEARHPRAAAPLAVSSWTALAWAAVAAGRPGAGAAVAGATTGLLAPRLHGLEHPWAEAARLAGRGHLAGGRLVAEALRRTWWPALAVAALGSRRARRLAAAVAVLPPSIELATGVPEGAPLGPAAWLALRLLDDAAYGVGVWVGAVRSRSAGALIPDLTTWPGRRPAVES